jgi:poly(beta-D-mannuronate) C5 epimerase
MSRRESPARRGRIAPYVMAVIAVLVSAVVATFLLGKEYRSVSAPTKFFHRHAFIPSFDPITDAEVGYAPSTMATNPGLPSRKVRAIMLYPHRIDLLAGGDTVRTIHLVRPVTTLVQLVDAVADPSWIARSGTTVTQQTAVVIQPHTLLRIAAPQTTELVLRSQPGVFLGSVGAHLVIAGVDVHGTTREMAQISRTSRMDLGRPFVVAYSYSRMEISDSTFRDLGRDWNASYGVSWSLGSTGSATGSTFERNFIGIYTDHAHNLLVKHNVFRHNTLYGVDPHSYSTGMDIEDNLSEGNGRHGIIFSDHVTAGIVRGNTTRGNSLNGIMMDASSTGNRILGNTTEDNDGDGIVLASSPHNVISGNRILRNRVGLHVRGPGAGVTVSGNTFRGNAMASQGLAIPDGNAVHGNGGQWRPGWVEAIWLGAVPLLLLLIALTGLSQRKYNRPARFREVVA